MKKETREWLIEFLKNNALNEDFVLTDLFYKEIIPREYSNIDELIVGIDEFFGFLLNNLDLIHLKENDNSMAKKVNIRNALENIKINFVYPHSKEQQYFAEVVSDVVEDTNQKSILDVGTGVIPISSMHLAKNYKRVSAMNPWFFLSTLALDALKVYPLPQIFDNKTDISDYDIVVGKSPCSAIEPIVKLCAQSKKPYFIQLCNCELDIKYIKDTDSFGWEDVLPQIDSEIRFYKEFAFHLDASTEKVINSINEFYMLDKRKTKLFGGKYISNTDAYIKKSELKNLDNNDAPQSPFEDDLGFFY